jgi:hypothetical protein
LEAAASVPEAAELVADDVSVPELVVPVAAPLLDVVPPEAAGAVELPLLLGGTLIVTLVFVLARGALAGALFPGARDEDGGGTTTVRFDVVVLRSMRVVVLETGGTTATGGETTIAGLSFGTGTGTVLVTTTVSLCGELTIVVPATSSVLGRLAK